MATVGRLNCSGCRHQINALERWRVGANLWTKGLIVISLPFELWACAAQHINAMKTKILASIVVVMSVACSLSAPPAPTHLLGSPAPVAAAQRTIVITPTTRHVNVEGGEVIRFVVGDKSFGWSFFVASTVSSFELNRVAPPGVLDHPVTAYVTPDPRYSGNGKGDKGK